MSSTIYGNEKFFALSKRLSKIIESNGGSVYNEDEIQGLLFMDFKEKAVRTVNEPKSEKEPYLLAALVLFLTEVIMSIIRMMYRPTVMLCSLFIHSRVYVLDDT